MNWNINTNVPFITFFLYVGLLILVITSRPQTESRRRFRWYLLAMALWSLSAFFLLIDATHSVTWMRIFASSAIPVMISLFFFTQTIIESKTRWARYIFYYGFVSIILTLFTNLVIVNASLQAGAIHYEFGPGMVFISGPSYLLVIYSVFLIISNFRKTEDTVQRNRLLYLSVAIGMVPLISIINFTPLGQYPIDVAVNGVSALIIAYAIMRYQLLDIRVVIRQGLVYSIPTIIIGTTYFLIITVSLNVFEAFSGLNIFIISLFVAIVSALLAEPLRDRAQQVIDRIFFREKYDSSQMLQTLSGSVASVLDLYKITTMILTEVCSTLHIPMAAFFLREEETNKFHLTTQMGQEDSQQIEFRESHPIILWLSANNRPLSRQDMEVLPQFQSLWRSERDDFERLEAELFIPIKVHESMVGIFVVSLKRSEQAYSQEDILILTTVANQTAGAIENARLYTSEQTRLKEMDTLYSMARHLVTTDNLDAVVDTVTRHAANSLDSTYAKLLIREENGDYICKSVYPIGSLTTEFQVGDKEPLVAEHYYKWIMQQGEAAVIYRNDYSLQKEEKAALFFEGAQAVCLSPLKGADEHVGLLILGDDQNGKDAFPSAKIRLINVISDYAASAIQRAMLHNRLEESFLQTVISLANAMDARDSYTGDHSQRMADMASLVGEEMRLPTADIETLHWAGILHDIGKIGVPDGILNKKGKLTKEEWVIMKEHPLIGAQIVEPVKYLSAVSPIIRAHHEKYDGTGYPYGLSGEDIPFGSRILAVVDAYVAIRDERVYRAARSHEEAIAELRRFSGTQFDPVIVDIFCKTIIE